MTDIDTLPPETLSPISDKAQPTSATATDGDILPTTTSNGRSRGTKASSVISSNSTTENPSIPQISVTESSSTATPSLANGRATASESLSSLSEIDTVDSEAETERIEDLDEDTEQPLLEEVNVEDGDEEPPATSVVGTSEDENRETSPSRGRKRRRATDIDDVGDQDEKPSDMDDEDHDAKRARSEVDDIDKPADPNDMPPEEIEEPEEPEPEESIPLNLSTWTNRSRRRKSRSPKKPIRSPRIPHRHRRRLCKTPRQVTHPYTPNFVLIIRIFAERSSEIGQEHDLVTSNQHPDIQKLFLELEANRTERIRRAKVTRKYRLQEIIRKYDVEAEIVKRQFLADKAGIREKLVSELTAQWFQIHREKRALDMCVPGNPPFPPPTRS